MYDYILGSPNLSDAYQQVKDHLAVLKLKILRRGGRERTVETDITVLKTFHSPNVPTAALYKQADWGWTQKVVMVVRAYLWNKTTREVQFISPAQSDAQNRDGFIRRYWGIENKRT